MALVLGFGGWFGALKGLWLEERGLSPPGEGRRPQ